MLKPSSCKPCVLYDIGNSFSESEGTGRLGVAVIGEALGHGEAIDGLPFRPKEQAGSKLNECIRSIPGLSRNDLLLYNILACQPPDNKLSNMWYEHKAIDTCKQHRGRVLSEWQVPEGYRKVILALGNTAFQTLTGREAESVLDVRGYPFKYTYDSIVQGDANSFLGQSVKYLYEKDTIVVGSYHPSFIRRGKPELTPALTEDIKKALAYARKDPKLILPADYRKKKNYRIVGHDEAWSYYHRLRDNPKAVISVDIETAESGYVSEEEQDNLLLTEDITQIQFATDKFNAVIFPNMKETYLKIAKLILELPNVKMGFNWWNFDGPRIRIRDIDINQHKIHDLMWMFKQWHPKLPRGLQNVASLAGFPFAWKHLFGIDLEEYGGADVCSLHFIIEWLVPLMQSLTETFPNPFHADGSKDLLVSAYGGYRDYVYKLHPIMENAKRDGTPVNDERRLELKVILEARRDKLDRELQEVIPDEIKNIEPCHTIRIGHDGKVYEGPVRDLEPGAFERLVKEVRYDYGFIRTPKKEIEEATIRYNEVYQKAENLGKRAITFTKYLRKVYSIEQRNVETFNRKSGESTGIINRWVRILPFKASKEQLSGYIEWKAVDLAKSLDKEDRKLAKLYVVPTDHKGKETTRKDEIELLFDKTGDIVLQMNLEMRSLTTNINNYIPNWRPNPQTGCVHTTWAYTAASGQINSFAPNVLNVSKHTEVGQEFRRIIEAPEGYVFLELDKKSFHVATMGYIANSPNYIRFSQIDPHSIFASYIIPSDWGIAPIKLDLSDAEIRKVCKNIKGRCKELAERSKKPHDDIRQYQAKPTVLGNQLGLGPNKLWWMNRRSITSKAMAEGFQATLADMFPEVELAKITVQKQADEATYLMNEFGYVQWFYDVKNRHWNKKYNTWDVRDGDEARDPIAFRVQGCAFGMIKDELFRIVERVDGASGSSGGRDRHLAQVGKPTSRLVGALAGGSTGQGLGLGYRIFRSSIHDSLVFMLKRLHMELVLPICIEEMSKPCGKLINAATGPEGLKVDVEWSVGRNLQNWHGEKNPEGMREGKY